LIQRVFTMSSSYKRYISKICLTVSSFENHTTFSITVSMPCNSRFRSWARLYVRLYHKRIFIFCDTLSLCHWDGTLYLYVRVWFCNRCQKRGRRSSTKPGRRSGCESCLHAAKIEMTRLCDGVLPRMAIVWDGSGVRFGHWQMQAKGSNHVQRSVDGDSAFCGR
jgi:hypothetical protein